jgi:hypothetical protein
MSEFEYSTDALNVKSFFYKSNSIIYVEGDDDVMFWNEIFSKFNDFNYQIEPLGGSEELDKYITKISSGELTAIAARDLDYTNHTKSQVNHDRVVYTYGYSLENSLYTNESIHALTKIWCKDPSFDCKVCENWLAQFSQSFRRLLALDIANATSKMGLNVLYDNCTQFMHGKTSSLPCSERIGKKIEEVEKTLPTQDVEYALDILGTNDEKIVFSIRGHFLASAVSKFISNKAQSLGKKVSLSNDALYSTAITYFATKLNKGTPHFDHYFNSAQTAVNACK